jgi:integrase/recombinase XerD
VEHRLRCLGYFLRWAGPRLPPAQRLRPAILEEYTLELARQPARRGGLLAASTRVYALRAFVRWLHGSRHHARDLRFALVPPRLPRPLPRAVMNAGEVERVLAATRPRSFLRLRDRAILELLYSTGIRRGELAKLEVGDVDWERRTVSVRHAKGGRGRVVPLGRRAGRWLGRYLSRVRPRLAGDDVRALFVSRRGGPLALGRLGDLVHAYVAASGMTKRGSCHMFRHSAASLMLEAGADIRFIQELLGHERLTSTQLYTRVSIASLQAVHARTHPAERWRRGGAQPGRTGRGGGRGAWLRIRDPLA